MAITTFGYGTILEQKTLRHLNRTKTNIYHWQVSVNFRVNDFVNQLEAQEQAMLYFSKATFSIFSQLCQYSY